MFCTVKLKKSVIIVCTAAILCTFSGVFLHKNIPVASNSQGEYIKWMDFNLNTKVMNDAMKYDIETNEDDYPVSWVDIIAYLAAKNGNNFSKYKSADCVNFVNKIKEGYSVEELTAELKHFDYYKQTYGAVLEEFVGSYTIEGENGEKKQKYGLKAYSPIGEGFVYSHYDDFGASRSFGFKRKHLGNDLMGRIGTPVTAIESGTVEAMGWNRYGGWRIGIRSFDKKRYYYYAHLRKDHPYQSGLKEGDTVQAGDVIGYLGMTGYSTKENVNNINIPHLHIGMQIIFDESQKEGNNEIWIDMYSIVEFLNAHKSTVEKKENGEYERKYKIESAGDGIIDYQR